MKSALLFALLMPALAQAATLTLNLRDERGNPAEDTVVYLMSEKTPGMPLKQPQTQIDQINKTFVPLVSVVQRGTRIQFPNKDNIRHHVYSFSKAKKFEIKLYADTPAKPILFDQPGYVAMGCNIHDTMIAHLLVVETPYFAVADRSGRAVIGDVPPGNYSLIAWHYMRPDKDALVMPVKLGADTTLSASVRTRNGD
ncbi:MAG: methylamine utilization protein [Thiobacillus sp.]